MSTTERAAARRPSFGVTCSGNFFGFDLLRRVEELGFDAFYTGEHFIYDKGIQDALPVLGAAAAATERIAIGSLAVLTPLYPPLLLAKAMSTIDLLSGGRLVLGVGVGGEFPAEFEAFGIPTAGRGIRTDEVIDIVRAYWTGEPVSFQGTCFQIDSPPIEPPPVQPGGPPIWVTGRAEAAMRRAALRGDGYVPYLVSANSFPARIDNVRSVAAEAGRELPDDFAFGVRLELRIDDSDGAAIERVASTLSWRFGRPFTPAEADRYGIAGSPATAVDKLRAYLDAGVDVFAFQPVGDSPEEMGLVLERFAAEVMPVLREGGGA